MLFQLKMYQEKTINLGLDYRNLKMIVYPVHPTV